MTAWEFLRAVERAVYSGSLLAAGEPVVVGVSGGPDSMVLLHALARLGHPVIAAHFDHGLRPESGEDAAWVATHCAPVAKAIELGRAGAPGLAGDENGSRLARLAFLEDVAARHGLATIALGHHADDQAETVLFRLVRGAGPVGLSGMAGARHTRGGRRIVRPLLGLTRGDVEMARAAWGVPALSDPSNTNTAYARNRLRHDVMPALSAINQGAVPHLNHFAALMREEAGDRQRHASRLALTAFNQVSPGVLEVDRAVMRALPVVEARWLVREACHRLGVPPLDVEGLSRCLIVSQGGEAADVGEGLHVSVTKGALVLKVSEEPPNSRNWAGLGGQDTGAWGWRVTVQAPEWGQPASPCRVRFDRRLLPEGLVWRSADPHQDEFWPWGGGRSVSLRSFLTRQGIPYHHQHTVLVLAAGGIIAWLVGIRRASIAPANEETTEVVEMQATAGFPV